MENINCPVCGEENSVAFDNCQYCNQPLRQSTSELDGAGKLIDSGQNPTSKKTAELESTLPAWLKNARQSGKEEDENPESPPAPPSPEPEPEPANPAAPLDWLAGLGDEDDEDDESADWLMNLQGDSAPEEKEDEEVIPIDIPAVDEPITAGDLPLSATEESDLPDWTSTLQGDANQEDSVPLPDLFEESPQKSDRADADEDGGLPDWLSALSKASDSSSAPSIETSPVQPASTQRADAAPPSIEASEPLPDWMADLQASAGTPIEEENTAEESSHLSQTADLPDWMGDSQSSSVAETPSEEASPLATSDENLPNWLSSGDATPAVEGTDADLPDWMGDLESSSVAETSSEEATPLTAGSEDLPDWLSSGDATPAVEGTDADLPDWMGDLESSGVAERPSEEATPLVASGEDIPDWMANLEPDLVAENLAEKATPSLEDGAPDWLSALPVDDILSESEKVEDAPLTEDAFETEVSQHGFDAPVQLTENAEETDIQDLLARMGKPVTGPLVEPNASEELADLHHPESETPDWLDDLPTVDGGKTDEPVPSSEPAFVGGADLDADIFGIETPSWLSNLGPEDSDEQLESDSLETIADDSAGDAELPSWVQAMRPVADVLDDSSLSADEHIIVETGPLAGLSDVLPASPGLGKRSKPRAHSIKIHVDESQQSSATMLEGLLASESAPSAYQKADKTSSMPVLRWVIAALLFLTVGASLLSKTRIAPSPNLVIPEVQDAIAVINELPANGSALVIFDYEAGYSGEMQAVAIPLVEHLMLRGQKLAFLSTSPMGPALAEDLLSKTQSSEKYKANEAYINLGYLPGNGSGMLSFISNPHRAIVAKVDDVNIWRLPPLENVMEFSDFSVIVILTDDVEKGRDWIEQSTTTLSDTETPFLMAISAQAEPIIYPYYASGQVDGLVSGLSGGAIYERMQGQDGLGRKYWDAYSLGLLTAEILIAVGAMVNLLAVLKPRQKAKEEE